MNSKFSDVWKRLWGIEPTNVNGLNNLSSQYHLMKLRQKLFARFEITGMPEWWNRGYFYELLFLVPGYLAISYDSALGACFFQCGYTGNNIFYQPTKINVANTVVGSFERKIYNASIDSIINYSGKVKEYAALVRMDSMFKSYQEMLNYYAYRLSSCDASIDVNLMNSKVANVFRAKSTVEKKNIEEMQRQINLGKPAVYVIDDSMPIDPYVMPVKQNFVGDTMQNVKRTIMEEFLTELGVNNSNTRKKERLTTDEVQSNNEEIFLNVQEVLTCVQEGLDNANKLFGLNLMIKLRDLKGSDMSEGYNSIGSSNMEA